MKQTNRKGFTLAELLIVVAIIAVLVAIAIPVFTAQKHKAEVAVDQANLRAYYAELQADFITTGVVKKLTELQVDFKTYKHLDGTKSSLIAGNYMLSVHPTGYEIIYTCNDLNYEHEVHFGN